MDVASVIANPRPSLLQGVDGRERVHAGYWSATRD